MEFFKDLSKAVKENIAEAKKNAEPQPNVYICKHCGNLRPEFVPDGTPNYAHILVHRSDTNEPMEMGNFICFDTPECKEIGEEWLEQIERIIYSGEIITITVKDQAFGLGPA